jgi:hypothetical protein
VTTQNHAADAPRKLSIAHPAATRPGAIGPAGSLDGALIRRFSSVTNKLPYKAILS